MYMAVKFSVRFNIFSEILCRLWSDIMRNDFSRISHFDINAEDISAGRLIWKRGSVDRFTGKGRSRNLLYLMLSGSRNYYINGKFEFSLHDGDVIFIPSGACYSSKVEECGTAEGIYVDFNLTLGGKPFYLDESFRRFTADRVQKERFMRLAESSGVRMLAKAELLYILSDISAKEENLRFEGGEFSRIKKAALGIERHPERQVDVGALARECCLSETGFRELFRRYTGGLAPVEYRNRLRLERADELLLSGTLSVAEIASLLGFYDTAHFYRTYKRVRGRTPKQIGDPEDGRSGETVLFVNENGLHVSGYAEDDESRK